MSYFDARSVRMNVGANDASTIYICTPSGHGHGPTFCGWSCPGEPGYTPNWFQPPEWIPADVIGASVTLEVEDIEPLRQILEAKRLEIDQHLADLDRAEQELAE